MADYPVPVPKIDLDTPAFPRLTDAEALDRLASVLGDEGSNNYNVVEQAMIVVQQTGREIRPFSGV